MNRLKTAEMFTSFTLFLLLWRYAQCQLARNPSADIPPTVFWSQHSSSWSKIRGSMNNPGSWSGTHESVQFVSTEPKSEVFLHAVDYNPRTKEMYWSDPNRRFLARQPWIHAAKWTDEGMVRFLTAWDFHIQGIAVDWLTGNVYATERNYGNVIVANDNIPGIGSNYVVVASGGMVSPKAICVDPQKGLIFWTDIGGEGKIFKATTTGENREELVKFGTTFRPVGLAIDRTNEILYVVDGFTGSIRSYNYDGQNQQDLHSVNGPDSDRAIAVSDSFLFVVCELDYKLYLHQKNGALHHTVNLDANPHDVAVPPTLVSPPTHVCDNLDCEHICINEGNRVGQCTCMQGYYFNVDGVKCETSINPRYMYTIGSSVVGVNASYNSTRPNEVSLNRSEIVKGFDRTQALGFHLNKRFVYFSDTQRGSIYRTNDTGEGTRELTVQQYNTMGISVHWKDEAVYWTDNSLNHIMMFKLDGRFHRIVLTGLNEPRGLAIDAVRGHLYWSQAGTERGIYMANLDGSNKRKFLDWKSDINQLTLDIRTKKLYCHDGNERKITWMNIITKEIGTAFSTSQSSAQYGVTVFQDYLTWTFAGDDLQFARETIKQRLQVNISTRYDQLNYQNSYDVITYDVYMQPDDITSPCDTNSCEHHCVSLGPNAMCSCAIGYSLENSGNCKSDLQDDEFIFFVDPYHKQIYQQGANFSDKGVQGVEVPAMDFPIAIDVDPPEGIVYWIDLEMREFKSSDVHGNNAKTIYKIPQGSSPRRMAYHRRDKKIYYTDFERRAIYSMKTDGSEHTTVKDNLNNPFAIAIDQNSSVIYWSEGGKVKQSEPPSYTVTDVVETGNVTCLTYDYENNFLFVGDKNSGKIISINMTSSQQKDIFRNEGHQIYALGASKSHVYFASWNKKGIYKVSIEANGASQPELLAPEVFARITDIVYVEKIALPKVWPLALIIGAAVGGFIFLLLLLLLLLLLGLLYRRRKNRDQATGTPEGGSGISTANIIENGDYANANEEPPVPPLGSRAPLNNVNTLLPNNVKSRSSIDGMLNGPGGNGGSTGWDGDDDGNGLAAQAAVAASSRQFLKNGNGLKSTSHVKKLPPVPATGFELKGGAQSSGVARFVNKLKTGVSSLRFKGEGIYGQAKAASRGGGGGTADTEGAMSRHVNGDETDTATVEEQNRKKPKAYYNPFMYPPKLHQQPRGHKPASPFTPATWKSSLSKKTGGQVSDNTQTM